MQRSFWVIGSRCLVIIFEKACSNMRDVTSRVGNVAGKLVVWLL